MNQKTEQMSIMSCHQLESSWVQLKSVQLIDKKQLRTKLGKTLWVLTRTMLLCPISSFLFQFYIKAAKLFESSGEEVEG